MKILHLVARSEQTLAADFRRLWRGEVASTAAAAGREAGCTGFVQNLLNNPRQPFAPTTHRFTIEWDAIDEYWFDGQDAQQSAATFQEVLAAVQQASGECVDWKYSRFLVTQEMVLAGHDFDGKDSVKMFIFIAPKPGLTQQRFFDHWTLIHRPVWAEVRSRRHFRPSLKSVQNYLWQSYNTNLDEFGYWGITEAWHVDMAALGEPFQGVEHDELVIPDANKFTDRGKVCDAFVDEFRIF